MSEEMKKVNTKMELTEDELDWVAGGAYSREEWRSMTAAERSAAIAESARLHNEGKPEECKYSN